MLVHQIKEMFEEENISLKESTKLGLGFYLLNIKATFIKSTNVVLMFDITPKLLLSDSVSIYLFSRKHSLYVCLIKKLQAG